MSDVQQTMLSRGSNYAKRQSRLEEDEAEIKRLEEEMRKAAQGEPEDGEKIEQEEDEGSDGKRPEDPKVPDEDDPKQEEDDPKEGEEEDDSKLSSEEKTFKKRYGDLRRHTQKLQDRIKALEEGSPQEGVRPPKSDEDIEEWASKYPDIAAIVETIASKKADEKFKQANARLEKIDEDAAEIAREKAEVAIRKEHKDFETIRQDDKFHEWVGSQPKWIQDALYENEDDAKSVIRVLDLYKVDKGLTKADNKNKTKDAAKSVDTRSTRTTPDKEGTADFLRESEVDRMSDKEYEENEDRILTAMREDKFIYDMTRG